MRRLFNGYYRPSEQEFDDFWKTAVIALDANVLLNLYRYSSETRDRLITVLEMFQSQLWLPYQAALEFHKNRLTVIYEQIDAYEKIKLLLGSGRKDLESRLGEFRRHPIIRIDSLISRIDKAFDSVLTALENAKLKHPSVDEDPVLNVITNIFDGRVGEPYSDEELESMYKAGELRYSKQKPPGYKDAQTKKGEEKYGDYIIWRQIIDFAKKEKKPVILVTDDVKEDWWLRLNGKTIGPRPELIGEIQKEASVKFYMYKTDQFMEYSKGVRKGSVSSNTLQEIRDVRKMVENGNGQGGWDNIISMLSDTPMAKRAMLIQNIRNIKDELREMGGAIKSFSQRGQLADVGDVIDKYADLENQLKRLSEEKEELERIMGNKIYSNLYDSLKDGVNSDGRDSDNKWLNVWFESKNNKGG